MSTLPRRGCARALPPEQKQAIELAYFGGLSHSEIAAQPRRRLGPSRAASGSDSIASASPWEYNWIRFRHLDSV
jgi:hypothetical protein